MIFEEWLKCAQRKCGHLVQLFSNFHAGTIHTFTYKAESRGKIIVLIIVHYCPYMFHLPSPVEAAQAVVNRHVLCFFLALVQI